MNAFDLIPRLQQWWESLFLETWQQNTAACHPLAPYVLNFLVQQLQKMHGRDYTAPELITRLHEAVYDKMRPFLYKLVDEDRFPLGLYIYEGYLVELLGRNFFGRSSPGFTPSQHHERWLTGEEQTKKHLQPR